MWLIFTILLCIGLNAVLAGIEIAFISVNKTLVRQRAKSGDKKAKKILSLKEKPEKTLATIQIGITLLASIAAATGGTSAGVNIVPIFYENFHVSLLLAEILAILFVVIPITYLSVVVGEIAPKSLAIRNPYYFARLGVPILKFISYFLYPVVKLCEKSTLLILQLIPQKNITQNEMEKEYHEHEMVLSKYHTLPKKGKEYMINLGNIQDKTLKDILLKWNQVTYVTTELSLKELEEKIISSGHTRMPVVEKGKVTGIINTKEILALAKSQEKNWSSFIRQPVRVKLNDSPLTSLVSMQKTRIHMGIVESDHQQPIGIVTIEDIIEEFLGEIYDEDDSGSLKRILKDR